MQWFKIKVQRCWDQIDLQSFRENGRSALIFSRQPSSSPATQLQLSSNLCHTLHRPVAATTAASPKSNPSLPSKAYHSLLSPTGSMTASN
ncbi:hypothetical protein ACFX1Z_028342 [Malus domestica]